jgi:hypothetical protein
MSRDGALKQEFLPTREQRRRVSHDHGYGFEFVAKPGIARRERHPNHGVDFRHHIVPLD